MVMEKLKWMMLLLCISPLGIPSLAARSPTAWATGAPNPFVLELASQKQLPVMPILSMTQGRDGLHRCCERAISC
jgi:hypothetical protein